MGTNTALWAPYWSPATAYLAGAVILPSNFGPYVFGVSQPYMWRCSVAGTSGATEPAWPDVFTTPNPSVTDGGTLTWIPATAFRQALQLGIMSQLSAFAAANPTSLRAAYSSRPRAFGETPAAWVGDIVEKVVIHQGNRERHLKAEVFFVDVQPDPQEVNDRQNFLVDALLEPLTAAYHAANPAGIMEPVNVDEPPDTEQASGAPLATVRYVLDGYLTEGRI